MTRWCLLARILFGPRSEDEINAEKAALMRKASDIEGRIRFLEEQAELMSRQASKDRHA